MISCEWACKKSAMRLYLSSFSAIAPAEQVNGGEPLTFAVFSCAQYQNGA